MRSRRIKKQIWLNAEEDNLIRDFQRETNTFLDPEKQIKHEEMEKEWDLER